jgi:hypothetical protein
MKTIVHNYSNSVNKTVLWDTSDNEENYLKNLQDSEKKKQLENLGFVDSPIHYQFNSHGFRTIEFDQPIDVVCFGCSFTMGTGVRNADTWPSQLQMQTGMTVANLGHAGSSNDTAFRFADHYLELLKPKYAVWQQTDMHRLELLDDHLSISLNILATDTENPCADDYLIKNWFTSKSNQTINLKKNTLAFLQICQTFQIKPLIVPRPTLHTDGKARDLCHPGASFYNSLAKQIANSLAKLS